MSRERPRRLLGSLGRAEVLSARLHAIEEEQRRESGGIERAPAAP